MSRKENMCIYDVVMGIVIFSVVLISVFLLGRNINKSDVKFDRVEINRLLQAFVLAYIFFCFTKIYFVYEIQILIVSILYMYTYPVIFFISNTDKQAIYNPIKEYTFSLFLALFLCSSRVILQGFLGEIIWNIILLVLILPILFELLYFFIYKKPVIFSVVQLIANTNYKEVKGYLTTIPLIYKLLIVLLVGGFVSSNIILSLYSVNKNILISDDKCMYGYSIMMLGLSVFKICRYSKHFYITRLIYDFKNYLKEIDNYNTYHLKNIVKQNITGKYISKKIGTVIIVIGESANSRNMNAFSDYYRENTPWLSKQAKNDNNFILFKKAYSSYVTTTESLSLALTDANQYNKKKFSDAISIIDIANKIGFNTYWYSNQGFVDKISALISMIGSDAHESYWLSRDYTSTPLDEVLIEYFKKQNIDKNKNNIIILHLKGSHEPFCSRYPESFNKYNADMKEAIGVNAYDNTIIYTDSILKEIYDYGCKNLNMSAMVYFSDHGQDPKIRRCADFTGFEHVRIPFFCYLSSEYIKLNEEFYTNLKKNQDKYFTNDLFFDFFVDLIGASYAEKNNIYSIGSSEYFGDENNLMTNLGQVYLKEDR